MILPITESQSPPTFDGQVLIYAYTPSGPHGVCVDRNTYIIYVNGINTYASTFMDTCVNLSREFACRVVGVFNQSYVETTGSEGVGLALDVAQCMVDYQLILDQASMFDVSPTLATLAKLVAMPLNMTLLLPFPKVNPATWSLFRVLAVFASSWPRPPVCIVAHSQGCLIASGALYTYAMLADKKGLAPPWITLFALASPSPAFAPFAQVKPYTNLDDLVPILSGGRSYTGEYADSGLADGHGVFDAHSVDLYREKPEFIRDLWTVLWGVQLPTLVVKASKTGS